MMAAACPQMLLLTETKPVETPTTKHGDLYGWDHDHENLMRLKL